MKTKTATVFGTLMYEGNDYICLCQTPIKVADEHGYPLELKDQHSFLVTFPTEMRDAHPKYNTVVDLYSAPFVVSVNKEAYAFIFEDPHEIVCIDDDIVEEEEPTDLTMAWSAETIIAREG